jgi:hypothetical protein
VIVGSLIYGHQSIDIKLEDRVLSHLQVVFSDKLRHNEGFHFSWADHELIGGGRTIVWVHPAMPLYFRYSGSRVPSLNRAWLDEMMRSINTSAGLVLRAEPRENGKT